MDSTDGGGPGSGNAPYMPTDTLTESFVTGEDVLLWRAEQLEAAGYEGDDILLLAERSDIDLHLAIGLLRKGCPSETAVRILL